MAVIGQNFARVDVFVLCSFYVLHVCAGNTLRITDKRMTWFESFNECNLADRAEAGGFLGLRYRAWAGALYLNTPWMVHAGCYKHTLGYAVVSHATHSNSPSECSFQCRKYQYFTLKGIWCNCGESIQKLIEAKQVDCSDKCPGVNIGSIKNFTCGSMKDTFVDVYRHISGEDVPTGQENHEFRCSVYKRQNTTITLTAVDCLSRHHSLCLQTDINTTAITVLPRHAQFEIAREQCNLLQNETINKDAISQLVTGKGYWTGIHRVPVVHWLEQESGNDICNEMAAKVNVKCIMVDRKAKDWVLFVPLPCTESVPAICKGNKLKATEKISDDCKDESRQNNEISTLSRSTYKTSSNYKHAERTSQLLSTMLDTTVPLITTELQTTANWSTRKSFNLSTVKQQADLTSSWVTSISDKIVSQYTTKCQTLTNYIHNSTSNETHNHRSVVFIITGGAFLFLLFVTTVSIVTVFLHKRYSNVSYVCCTSQNITEKFNRRTRSYINNTTPQTKRRKTFFPSIPTIKVSTDNLYYKENDNQYQLELMIPKALHKTCNIVMSQDGFPSYLQTS